MILLLVRCHSNYSTHTLVLIFSYFNFRVHNILLAFSWRIRIGFSINSVLLWGKNNVINCKTGFPEIMKPKYNVHTCISTDHACINFLTQVNWFGIEIIMIIPKEKNDEFDGWKPQNHHPPFVNREKTPNTPIVGLLVTEPCSEPSLACLL